jgi:hypothetical protein
VKQKLPRFAKPDLGSSDHHPFNLYGMKNLPISSIFIKTQSFPELNYQWINRSSTGLPTSSGASLMTSSAISSAPLRAAIQDRLHFLSTTQQTDSETSHEHLT